MASKAITSLVSSIEDINASKTVGAYWFASSVPTATMFPNPIKDCNLMVGSRKLERMHVTNLLSRGRLF